MKVRQRRPRDAGSIVSRKRADGSESFMLKWKTYTRTVEATSKREALALLPAFVAEAQSGHIDREKAAAKAKGELPTLTEWAKVFLDRHTTQDPDRVGTVRAYRTVLRLYAEPALGEKRLGDLTPVAIRTALQDVHRAGKSVATVALAHAALRQALAAAVTDGLLAASPMPAFAEMKLGSGPAASESAKRRAYTAEQVAALLAAAEGNPPLRLFIAIMASAGLRPGEAGGLRWRDVDLKAGTIDVCGSLKRVWAEKGGEPRLWIGGTKSGRTRVLTIGPTLTDMLAQEKERQEAAQRMLRGSDTVQDLKPLLTPMACVFPAGHETPETPRTPSSLRSQFETAATRAGVPGSPHWLRHTFVSHSLAAGRPLPNVSRDAGHKNPAITARVYSHALPEDRTLAVAADALLTARPEQNGGSSKGTSDKVE